MNEIFFLNKYCKQNEHVSCCGSWVGLGFQVNCKCVCHEKKVVDVAGGLRDPDSATSINHSSGVTNSSD